MVDIPNDPGLHGKAAIVTGAGSAGDGIGNGRAAAILLAQAGVRVLAVDLDLEEAERTVTMIREAGGEATAFQADVTKNGDCAAMVAAAGECYGRLDILDNNVGIASRGSVVAEREEDWDKVMRVNVTSMFLAAKHAVPAMMTGGRGGAIVNVASIAALRPRGMTAYSTSKGAVIALTRAMAFDHGPDGIRVNCVAPGPVYTPMVSREMTDRARTARRAASILGIEGTGWDVGHAAVFLCSDHARYITGQTLVVDGGVTLRAPEREF